MRYEYQELGQSAIQIIDGDRGKNYPKGNDFFSNGYCLFLNAKNVTADGFSFSDCVFISEEKDKLLRKGKLQRRDIVLTTRGTVGNVAYFNDNVSYWDMRINSGMVIIRADPDIFESEFIYWLFRSDIIQNQILQLRSGTAQPQLPISSMQRLKIPVPPLAVQKAIVSIIGILQHKIELNQKINENLQQQAAAIFKSWFVDCTPFESVVPEEWEKVSLEDITSLVSRGITPKYTDNSEQIVINQKCIRNHTIDLSWARFHTPKAINEKWLHFGDLLINSTGAGTLGRTAQVWFQPQNLTVDSHVTIIRPVSEKLIFYIGFWGILHEKEIEALHTGSTGQTELPRDRVKTLNLLLPDNGTLDRFNALIAPMAAAIVSNQRENDSLEALRDSLLPKLMSGELDVSSIQR